jgi:hypothetical protein
VAVAVVVALPAEAAVALPVAADLPAAQVDLPPLAVVDLPLAVRQLLLARRIPTAPNPVLQRLRRLLRPLLLPWRGRSQAPRRPAPAVVPGPVALQLPRAVALVEPLAALAPTRRSN